MSVRDDDIRDDSTSFEVERHTDDQPPRDDLIEPDDIGTDGTLDEGAGVVDDPDAFHRDEEPPRAARSSDDLPESQGYDADEAEQLAEDDSSAPLNSDELG